MAVSTIDALYNGGSEKVTATSTGIDVKNASDPVIKIQRGTGSYSEISSDSNGTLFLRADEGNTTSASNIRFEVDNTEHLRLDEYGQLILQSNPSTLFLGGTSTGSLVKGTSTGNYLIFGTSGAEQARFVGSNFGIGTTSPEVALHIVAPANENPMTIEASTNSYNYITHRNAAGTDVAYTGLGGGAALVSGTVNDYVIKANANLLFGAGSTTERMRLTSGGYLALGNTSLPTNGTAGVTLAPEGNVHCGVASTANTDVMRFDNPNGRVGAIQVTGTSTSYVTSSDYRLKTDAQPMTGASARVQALNPVNFEWIADGTRVDGFLAHEAQDIVPEAVSGTKDAMRDEEYEVTPAVLDDDGNVVTEAVMGTRSVPDYQGIDQSKLVPLLTAALQEALTEIAALKARVTTLEG